MATLSYHFDTPASAARVPARARRIAVVGASGGTGSYVVGHALASGFHVTAIVRDPQRVPLQHPALRVVQADVLVPASLLGLLDGHEAVIVALGTMPEGADRARRQPSVPVCSQGTANVVAEMRTAGIKRLVVLSAAGVGESRRTGRYLIGHLVHRVLRQVVDDKERQEAIVRTSGLRWTILRPVRFNRHPASGSIEVGEDLRWGWGTVSRDDVAEVLVKLIDQRSSYGMALTAA
jgi:uncharacterized protein YbjT (DUF2867 family)